MTRPTNPIHDEIEGAIHDEDTPKLYANSFSCALGIGDIAILLKNGNSNNIALLNLSYTTAKTLSLKLQEMISFLEARSGHTVMTIEDVKKSFEREKENLYRNVQ